MSAETGGREDPAALRDGVTGLLGIPVHAIRMDEGLAAIGRMVEGFRLDGRARQVVTLNVDFLVQALGWAVRSARHPELYDVMRRADLVVADGMPVVWASRLLGGRLPERVAGADMVPALAAMAAEQGFSIFLLGGKPGSAEQAARLLQERNPGLQVAGVLAPDIASSGAGLASFMEDDVPILAAVNDARPDILLIGLGCPKQELWFHRNRRALKAAVSIGVGGTFEFICGNVARAPAWMQRSGLEWLFRIYAEPTRLWRRYALGLIQFSFLVLPPVVYARFRMLLGRFGGGAGTGDADRATVIPGVFRGSGKTARAVEVMRLPRILDRTREEELRGVLYSVLESGRSLILDAADVQRLDAAGEGLLLGVWRRAQQLGLQVRLASVHPIMQRSLRVARCWDLFAPLSHASIEDALPAIGSERPAFYWYAAEQRGVRWAGLFGRLDVHAVVDLGALSLVEELRAADCILSLKGLEFVDSTGLQLFLQLHRRLQQEGGYRLVLIEVPVVVGQLFKITKVERLLHVFKDMPSALGFLSGTLPEK